LLDLFCGAGGLAQGFKRAGFEVTGVDISEAAGKTFELNLQSKFIRADLSSELINGTPDVIIGGPPCRPWSAVNVTKRGRRHEDYHLLSKYFQHVEYHSPKVFLFENVPSIRSDTTFIDYIERLGSEYSIRGEVVAYSDYGASSRRHRLILLGTKQGNASEFFRKLSRHKRSPKTVMDAIGRLRYKKKNEVPDHIWPELTTISKYRRYYETGKFGWYVLRWKKPAPSFGNVMKTYILHPDSFNGSPPRVISVREALLIMGYDKDFRFPDGVGLGSKYQMVVDSVSPVFSHIAAEVMKDMFFGESS
jgi:DNA (cytosine-5)-methyltransferase 1